MLMWSEVLKLIIFYLSFFFVEVSYGPFHQHPEDHIDDDNRKLSKLGKDALDRNMGYTLNGILICLFNGS
jgi:hypothetical protein